MAGSVLSSTMTLDGSQYLATNAKVLQATQLVEASLQKLKLQLTQITTALAPLTGAFAAVTGSVAGLAGDAPARGTQALAAALAVVAQQASNATNALAGARDNAEGLGNAVDQNEGVNKSEAETPAAASGGRAEGVALGAVAEEMGHLEEVTHHATKATAEHNKESQKAAEQAKRTRKEIADERAGFRGLGETVSKTAEIMRDAFLAVPEIAGLVGVFAGVAETVKKVRESFEYGDQLNALSRQTGESAETIAALRRTFEYFDVSADEVGHTLFMLQRALGGISEGGEPTAAAFGRIGLSIAQLKGMNAADQFAAIQAGLAKLPTQADRANVAMKIFGRSALEVQSILNASPADFAESMRAAQEYAQVMGRSADMFEEIERKFYVFREQVDTVFARIAVALGPAISDILDKVNKVDFSKWGVAIEKTIGTLYNAFKSGDLTDAVFLAIDLGAMKAVQKMVGYFTAAAAALNGAIAAVFTGSFWEGMKDGFLGVAESFGAKLLEVLKGPISLLQAAIEYNTSKGTAAHNAIEDQKAIDRDKAIVARSQAHYDRINNVQVKGQAEQEAKDRLLAPLKDNLVSAMSALVRDQFQLSKDTFLSKGGQSFEDFYNQYGQEPTLFGKKTDDLSASAQKHLDTAGSALTPVIDKIAVASADAYDKVQASGNILTDAIAKTQAKLDAIYDRNKPQQPEAESGRPQGAATQTLTGYNYKQPEGDRLQKLGLFLGTHAAAPGLSELRSIKNATEGSLRALNVMASRFNLGGGLKDVAIPRYQ